MTISRHSTPTCWTAAWRSTPETKNYSSNKPKEMIWNWKSRVCSRNSRDCRVIRRSLKRSTIGFRDNIKSSTNLLREWRSSGCTWTLLSTRSSTGKLTHRRRIVIRLRRQWLTMIISGTLKYDCCFGINYNFFSRLNYVIRKLHVGISLTQHPQSWSHSSSRKRTCPRQLQAAAREVEAYPRAW